MTNIPNKHPLLYICELCNFSCSNKKDYNRHLHTAKHIRMTNNDKNTSSLPIFLCECGKQYKYRQGLHYHKKNCNKLNEEYTKDINDSHSVQIAPVSNPVDSSLVIELLKQNQEFKELMIEQHKRMTEQQDTIIELSKNTGNTTINNTNNTTNNKFNLNVFLNETCKDAINLNDFIQSIELTVNDFIKTGEVGYVRGISDIMLERIRDMHPHVRPIHCTDLKRETVYVKDSNVWAKEDETKMHLRKAVRIVANKNKAQVHPWIAENPKYDILDTPECDKFFEYSKASLGGYGKEEDEKFEKKIINNILKETVIDKETVITTN